MESNVDQTTSASEDDVEVVVDESGNILSVRKRDVDDIPGTAEYDTVSAEVSNDQKTRSTSSSAHSVKRGVVSTDDASDNVVLKEGDRMLIDVFDETVEVICQSSEGGASNDGMSIDMEIYSQDSQDEDKTSGPQQPDKYMKTAKKRKLASQHDVVEDVSEVVESSCIYEYQWPADRTGDWYVLQEQISEFLGIVSFKRKYPDIYRRAVDFKERKHLRDENAVTEMQCDLGLTALRTDEVFDLMARDYPDKFEEYTKVLRKRRAQKLSDQNKLHEANSEKNKAEYLMKKAIKSTADFNEKLRRERQRAYFDLQTYEVHRPQKRVEIKCSPPLTSYPVALIPGQFQEYYKRYTPEELRYFPINTILYTPHKQLKSLYVDPNEVTAVDSDDEPFKSLQPPQLRDDEKPGRVTEPVVDSKQDVIETSEPIKAVIESGSMLGVSESSQDSSYALHSNHSSSSKLSSIKTPSNSRSQSPMRRVKPPPSDKMSCSKKISQDTPSSSAKYKSCVRKRHTPIVPMCSICNQTDRNKNGEFDDLISCAQCRTCSHPTCLDLTKEMIPVIKAYRWQCMECKACIKCKNSQDEEKMLFCDHCDRGYHTYCVGLDTLPEGRWDCPKCMAKQQQPKPDKQPDKVSEEKQMEETVVKSKSRRGRAVKYPGTEDRLSRAERMAQRNKAQLSQSVTSGESNDVIMNTDENSNQENCGESQEDIETGTHNEVENTSSTVTDINDKTVTNQPKILKDSASMDHKAGTSEQVMKVKPSLMEDCASAESHVRSSKEEQVNILEDSESCKDEMVHNPQKMTVCTKVEMSVQSSAAIPVDGADIEQTGNCAVDKVVQSAIDDVNKKSEDRVEEVRVHEVSDLGITKTKNSQHEKNESDNTEAASSHVVDELPIEGTSKPSAADVSSQSPSGDRCQTVDQMQAMDGIEENILGESSNTF